MISHKPTLYICTNWSPNYCPKGKNGGANSFLEANSMCIYTHGCFDYELRSKKGGEKGFFISHGCSNYNLGGKKGAVNDFS